MHLNTVQDSKEQEQSPAYDTKHRAIKVTRIITYHWVQATLSSTYYLHHTQITSTQAERVTQSSLESPYQHIQD